MSTTEFQKTIISFLFIIFSGLIFFGLGLKGVAALILICTGGVVLTLIYIKPCWFFSLSIPMLGLAPFLYGIDVGAIPKLFYDELILLCLIGYSLLSFILSDKRALNALDPKFIVLCLCLLVGQGVTFLISPPNYIAARNFIETYLLGVLLFYVYAETLTTELIDRVVDSICLTIVIISLLTLIEAITRYNPIMMNAEGILYLSPELTGATHNIYRPYVSFFHPSEAGTFMAMGLPFVVCRTRHMKPVLKWGIILLVLSAIACNYTRGVWFGTMMTGTLFYKRLRRSFFLVLPVALVLFLVANTLFHDMPIIKRLSDPTNLTNRFFYWRVGCRIFMEHWLIGIGHMNFKEIYLGYIQGITLNTGLDIKDVSVVDNLYLMTLVEHGMAGLASLGCFLFCLFKTLRNALAPDSPLMRQENARAIVKTSLATLALFCFCGMLADVHLFTKATKFFFITGGIGIAATRPRPIHSDHSDERSWNIASG